MSDYDKCKWEAAWGEMNAALHADHDAQEVIQLVGGETDVTAQEYRQHVRETFNDIAEKHGVETFDECWNGEVEECDEHE